MKHLFSFHNFVVENVDFDRLTKSNELISNLIAAYNRGNIQLTKIRWEEKEFDTYSFAVGNVSPTFGDLMIAFVPSDQLSYCFFSPIEVSEDVLGYKNTEIKYAIVLNILNSKKDIVDIDTLLSDNRKVFIHELMHYFDRKSGKKRKGFPTMKLKNSYQNYINTPDEFNAFYHEAIGEFIHEVDSIGYDYESIFSTFNSFKNTVFPYFHSRFLGALSTEYMEIFYKELLSTYNQLKEKYLGKEIQDEKPRAG